MNLIDVRIGDSRQLMKSLASKSVDIILTSPPFKDEDVIGDYWEFYDDCFQEMIRVAKKAVCVIHSSTKMNEIIKRYPPKRTLIWGKGIIAASYRYNPIFVYQISDDYKVNKYIWTDTIAVNPINGKNKSHKYEDPHELYVFLLKMFNDCKSVLDPFAGSGTTAKACRILGLNCIVFDNDIKYKRLIEDKAGFNTRFLDSFAMGEA